MRSRSPRVLLWAGRPLMELRSTFRRAAVGWRSGRRPWLGLSLAASTGAADLLLHLPSTAGWVSDATALSAGLPIGQWLTRLPGSLLVPTPDLPLWLAMAQLTVVVGLAELLLPRRLVLAVGVLGHLLPTLAARLMVELGPGSFIGVPRYLANELDTGPSALTTAVGGFLLLRCGARRVAVILGVALLLAVRLSPGLDGREHLLALLVGAGAAAVSSVWHRRTETARPSVPVLSGPWALGVLTTVALGLVVASGYHPVQPGPSISASGTRAVELRDRTHLPVELSGLPAGTWISATASCPRPEGGRDPSRSLTTVWRRPRYLCANSSAAPVVLRYRIAGIPETQHLRNI